MDEATNEQDGAEIEIAVHIDAVCWSPVRIEIDGECVGVLKKSSIQIFSTAAGVRKVTTRCKFLRSETLELTLAPGQRIALESGFHKVRMTPDPGLYVLMIAILFMAFSAGLLLTSLVLDFLLFVGWEIVRSVRLRRPGAFLYVRLQGALPEPTSTVLAGRRLPRFTLAVLMIAVAITGVLSWAVIKDLRVREQAHSDRMIHRYRSLAKVHEYAEQSAMDLAPDSAIDDADEARWREYVQTQTNWQLGDLAFQVNLQALKRQLDRNRALRARFARQADYHRRMKEKYLKAASKPWEPVAPDPPPPP